MTDGLIGITGATGGVGGRTARRLADRGVAQRLIVRDPSRAPELDGAEVRTIAGYHDAQGLQEAAEGVHTLFLIPAKESADRLDQHRTAVQAIAAAGVQRIVYLSFLNASPEAAFTFARHHHATEQMVRETGVPFTFLRDSIYLDFTPRMVSADGVIAGPADEGHVAPILRDDIADVAAAVLTEDGHDGQAYDLTGRDRFTLAEAAETMSRLSGKRIVFHDETLEEAYASRAKYNAADWEVEGWVSNYLAIAKGELDVVSDTVQRLAGHEPVTLAEYVEAHPEALEHVTA